MPYPKKKIPTEHLVKRYQAGDSLTAIATAAQQEFGISISWVAVRQRLIAAQVFVPNRNKVIRHTRTPHKQRERHSRTPPRLCAFVGGCSERTYADHDYCKKHQARVDRHGDPGVVLKPGRKVAV